MSSWSACYAVSEMDLQRAMRRVEEGEGEEGEEGRERERGEVDEESVPLGEVMLGTRMEVRDASSSTSLMKRVHQGYGEIYLGEISLPLLQAQKYCQINIVGQTNLMVYTIKYWKPGFWAQKSNIFCQINNRFGKTSISLTWMTDLDSP